MKILLHKITFLILFISLCSFMESTTSRDIEVAERIKGSIKMGDAHNLADHFEKNMELVIDSERVSFRNVRNEQAELILKGFFKKYPPKDFKYVFQGTASKVRYCTATYQPATGGVFQVYILMRITEKDYLINTLHFKKE
jgi:Domain of unknown function (DUF4783)